MFKKQPIKFNGTKEVENSIKNQTDNVISHRFKLLIIIVLVIGFAFLVRLFFMQIQNKDYYSVKLQQYNTNTFQVDTLRGEIYDRNYQKLAYNKNVICATYYAVKNISDEEIDAMIKFLINNCNVDISKVTVREKKDYLIMKDEEYVKSLISESENDRIKGEDDYNTLYYNLQINKITEEIINEKLSTNDIKYYKLYFSIKNCSNGSALLLEDISIKEASVIGENNDLLRGVQVTSDWTREYNNKSLFKQTLGNVTTKKQGLPAELKDELLALDYSNDSRVGTSGLEYQYESFLSGKSSTYKLTYDEKGNPSINVVDAGSQGLNLRLTIDWEIQQKLSNRIEEYLKAKTSYQDRFFKSLYVILMDPNNGDIIAMAGKRRDKVGGEIYDYAAGNYLSAYAIGSTMKAATLYTAFKHNVTHANNVILDEVIRIKDTPPKQSHRIMGYINEVQAIAYSSNIYMMKLMIKLGGDTYKENEPLSIDPDAFTKLRNGAGELGLGVKTGLDVPYESLGYRGKSTMPGLLLDFAIGQYDTYTNMQLATYTSTIANQGVKVQPHLYLDAFEKDSSGGYRTVDQHQVKIVDDVSDQTTFFKQLKKGMVACTAYGTAKSTFAGFGYSVASKSGTAEVLENNDKTQSFDNHMLIAYAPVEDPQIVVSAISEREKGNSATKLSRYALELYLDKYGSK